MNNTKWLVFDLGGVLADYVGTQKLLGWMSGSIGEQELYRHWLFSPTVRAFESGRMDFGDFTRGIIHELGLNISPGALMNEFPNFVTGYFPGAEELLTELSARYPLAMLSNTNSPQWGKLRGISGVDRLFSRIFLSFETGYVKPDAETYQNVIRTLECPPEAIIFFDDNPDNVRGALNAGMMAERVGGFEGLKEIIKRLGL